jgi:hypothetical protein
MPLYEKVIKQCRQQIQEYFPNKTISEIETRPQGMWTVINCHIGELEGRLKKLPPGEKKIAISRWQDQVTVIVSEDS